MLQMINKVEIQGIVGYASVTPVGEGAVINFSVAVDTVYASGGQNVIETTWFQVRSDVKNLKCKPDDVTKGAAVHVLGRFQVRRYTDFNGMSASTYSILASSVETLSA